MFNILFIVILLSLFRRNYTQSLQTNSELIYNDFERNLIKEVDGEKTKLIKEFGRLNRRNDFYKDAIKKSSRTHLPAYFRKAITRLLKDSARSKAKKGGCRSKSKCCYYIDIDYQILYIYITSLILGAKYCLLCLQIIRYLIGISLLAQSWAFLVGQPSSKEEQEAQ